MFKVSNWVLLENEDFKKVEHGFRRSNHYLTVEN